MENRLQSGVTPAGLRQRPALRGSVYRSGGLPWQAEPRGEHDGGRGDGAGLSAASAKELAEALEQSAERLMEPYAVSGRFCFQGVRG